MGAQRVVGDFLFYQTVFQGAGNSPIPNGWKRNSGAETDDTLCTVDKHTVWKAILEVITGGLES